MMKLARALLALLAVGAVAMGQTVKLANPSFEEGASQPAGWTLNGSGKWLDGGAADGQKAILAQGNGKDSTFWRSGNLPLLPATVYRLAFRAMSIDASGGTAIAGPAFCNRDLGKLPPQWKNYESIFITPENLTADQSFLRFGQWNVRGATAFDAVELQQAIPVYARYDDLALGEGESLMGNEYAFDAPLRGVSRNQSRPLASYTCTFNSERWVLGGSGQVVYRHRIGERKQTAAEVQASVTWYAAGGLVVEASADGKNWQGLGTIGKLGSGTYKVPASLLPAEEVYVRLRAAGSGASLQVGGYGYKATVTGRAEKLIGRTSFVAVSAVDPRLAVTIDDLGDALPGGQNVLIVNVKNQSDQRILAQPLVTVEQEGQAPKASKLPAMLEPGETELQIPYEVPGPGISTLHLSLGEKIAFSAQTSLHVADLYSTSYGQRLPASDDQAGVWWASSGWKISRSRPVPRASGEAMVISVARNEAEAAQLVIRPSRLLRDFSAKAEVLSGPEGSTIPAENVEILRERYLFITRPTDSTGTVGYWPDPLPPLSTPIELEPDQNQPLWIRVKAPKDAKAGTYSGRIHLKAIGYEKDVAVRVNVYDFALPDRMTCQTAFGFSPGNVYRYQHLQSTEDRRAVLEKYWADFSAHHISPYDPAPMDPIKVTWPDKEKLVPAFDLVRWDEAMARAIGQYHFNSFRLNIPGMGGGTFHDRVEPELLGYREDASQYKLAFNNYCKALESHLREKGWLNEAYVYWFDEPDPKDYAFVMNGFRKLKEAAPALNRMLTEQVEPALVGGPNLWCPVTPEYNPERAEPRRAAGERFWWYVCTGPKAPYCTLFIDHPATEMRVWLWQTWQRKIDGILVWETNYWTSPTAYPDTQQDPYEDPMSWQTGYSAAKGSKHPWGNGDGRFVYPPQSQAGAAPGQPILAGPVDSIRWEMLRDGIEDYQYLVILRDLLGKRGDKLPEAQRAQFRSLLEVPAEITRDMTTFTADPTPIERRREALAKAIEAMGKF
jgi:hypothetical protein